MMEAFAVLVLVWAVWLTVHRTLPLATRNEDPGPQLPHNPN